MLYLKHQHRMKGHICFILLFSSLWLQILHFYLLTATNFCEKCQIWGKNLPCFKFVYEVFNLVRYYLLKGYPLSLEWAMRISLSAWKILMNILYWSWSLNIADIFFIFHLQPRNTQRYKCIHCVFFYHFHTVCWILLGGEWEARVSLCSPSNPKLINLLPQSWVWGQQVCTIMPGLNLFLKHICVWKCFLQDQGKYLENAF